MQWAMSCAQGSMSSLVFSRLDLLHLFLHLSFVLLLLLFFPLWFSQFHCLFVCCFRVRNDPCATKLTYSFFHIVSNSFLDLVAHSSVEKCIVELGTVASSNAVKVDLAAKDGRLSLTTSKKPKDYFNEKQRIKMCSSRR